MIEIKVKARFQNITVGGGSGGGSVVIKNSAGTTIATATISPYILADNTYKVSVNGVLKSTTTGPSLANQNINITA